jgi:hypothetical protein
LGSLRLLPPGFPRQVPRGRFRGHSFKMERDVNEARQYNHMPCSVQKLILPSFDDSMPTLASE